MATHYLLPCQCGKKTEVDSSQAGLQVRCECGTELPVPAMRGMAALERVDREADKLGGKKGSTWGRRQGLMFLGGVLVAGAGLIALFFWSMFPQRPILQYDFEAQQELSPVDSFTEWRELQKGIELPDAELHLSRFDQITDELLQWEMVCGGVAAVGLLFIIVGLATPANRGPAERPAAMRS